MAYPEEYLPEPCSPQGIAVQKPRTLSEKLKEQKVALEAQLADVNAALKAVESNPEVLAALNALSKVRGIGY